MKTKNCSLRLILPLMALVLFSGCMSTKAKLEAVKTVADLKATLKERDDAQQKAVEGLVRQVMESQRVALQSRWKLRKEELKVELYGKSENRLEELRTELVNEVNKALDPVETRLKNEIEAENARGAAGAERAAALRLQLASTLAITQRETAKADNQITEKMRLTRDGLLKQLDDEFKTMPAGIEGAVTEVEMDEVLKDVRASLASYREGIDKTTDSLTSYLTADQPWQLFLKGLVGEKLYQMVGPKLTEKLNGLASTLESTLATKTQGLLDRAVTKLAGTKREK